MTFGTLWAGECVFLGKAFVLPLLWAAAVKKRDGRHAPTADDDQYLNFFKCKCESGNEFEKKT